MPSGYPGGVGMNFDRMYGKCIDENDLTVTIVDNGKHHTLQRCRMYNSQLVGNMLYCDYAEKEYQQTYSSVGERRYEPRPVSDRIAPEIRRENAKKGWETRRSK